MTLLQRFPRQQRHDLVARGQQSLRDSLATFSWTTKLRTEPNSKDCQNYALLPEPQMAVWPRCNGWQDSKPPCWRCQQRLSDQQRLSEYHAPLNMYLAQTTNNRMLDSFPNRTPTSLNLLHTTCTYAFKSGCLMSYNWLHDPDCKVSNEVTCMTLLQWACRAASSHSEVLSRDLQDTGGGGESGDSSNVCTIKPRLSRQHSLH